MLVGERVVLRTLRQADLDVLYSLAADIRDMGDYWPLSLLSEIKWRNEISETGWLEQDHGALLITNHEDHPLGQILFFKPSSYQSSYELGYRIYKPENWGKGYMSEAVSLLVAYLFATKPVDRIQATTMVGNEGSQKVLKTCGFQFEGTLRKAIFHQGQSLDLHLYSILREEAPSLKDVLASED